MIKYRTRDRTRSSSPQDLRTRTTARARTRTKKGGSMTPDEAIKELRNIGQAFMYGNLRKKAKAVQLGIEGLELIQRERALGINPVETRLPSETAD